MTKNQESEEKTKDPMPKKKEGKKKLSWLSQRKPLVSADKGKDNGTQGHETVRAEESDKNNSSNQVESVSQKKDRTTVFSEEVPDYNECPIPDAIDSNLVWYPNDTDLTLTARSSCSDQSDCSGTIE